MKIFQNLLGKDNDIVIAAPVSGKLISIQEVDDPTFSDEILGKGVAIIPSDGKIYAPADGTINTVVSTGHAIAMSSSDGAEILIHVGIDTVRLNGKYFTTHTYVSQKVKKGDLLLEADIEKIRAEGYDIITPVIIYNADSFSGFQAMAPADVAPGDDILILQK